MDVIWVIKEEINQVQNQKRSIYISGRLMLDTRIGCFKIEKYGHRVLYDAYSKLKAHLDSAIKDMYSE
jgi:hypothetical protein